MAPLATRSARMMSASEPAMVPVQRWKAAVFAAGAAADGSRDLAAVVRERGWSVTVAGIVVLLIAIVVIGSIGKRALRRALDAQEAASESS